MGQIIVSGIDDADEARLQARAMRHGQSIEAEVRDILHEAVKDEGRPAGGLGTRIAAHFAEIGLKPGEELERPEWGEPRNPFED